MGYRETILATPNLALYARFGESNPDAGVVAEYGPSGQFAATRPDLNAAGALVGDPNTCYRWAASNSDHIYWPGNLFTFSNTTAFSLEIWYQPTTLAPTNAFMNLVSKDRYDAYASGYGLYLQNSDKRLIFARVNSSGGSSRLVGPIVSMGNWYHIVCTYDGATMRMYINGSLFSSLASSLSIGTDTGTPLFLGKSAQWDGEYLSAWMDEFAIYNRALSSTEVSQHYNTGINPITPEESGANPVMRFSTTLNPQRVRTGSSQASLKLDAAYAATKEVKAYHSFTSRLGLNVDGNVSAFPSHSMPASSTLIVNPVRQKRLTQTLTMDHDVLVRMPMKFLESHAFSTKITVVPKSKVTYKSNKPKFPISFTLGFSGMTRMELDQLFEVSAIRRSGAIHYATKRIQVLLQ